MAFLVHWTPNTKSSPPTTRRNGVRERCAIAGADHCHHDDQRHQGSSNPGHRGAPTTCHPHSENDRQRLDHLDGRSQDDCQNKEGFVLQVPTLSHGVVFATYDYRF